MTYERGAELGCPDCIAGELHCCPFLWADAQEGKGRRWALAHLRHHLADEIEEALG